MESSLFGKLPAEIRNDIYKRILIRESSLYVPECAEDRLMGLPKGNTSIMRTCRQISEEASSIFYGSNTFHFQMTMVNQNKFPHTPYTAFRQCIGPVNAKQLRHLVFHGGMHGATLPEERMTKHLKTFEKTMEFYEELLAIGAKKLKCSFHLDLEYCLPRPAHWPFIMTSTWPFPSPWQSMQQRMFRMAIEAHDPERSISDLVTALRDYRPYESIWDGPQKVDLKEIRRMRGELWGWRSLIEKARQTARMRIRKAEEEAPTGIWAEREGIKEVDHLLEADESDWERAGPEWLVATHETWDSPY